MDTSANTSAPAAPSACPHCAPIIAACAQCAVLTADHCPLHWGLAHSRRYCADRRAAGAWHQCEHCSHLPRVALRSYSRADVI